jgi:hypothetical protein
MLSGQVPGTNSTPPRRLAGTSAGRATTTSAESGFYTAFDASEKPVVGVRQREWEAVADSEEAVVREMARCLGEIGEGRAPK